MQQSAWLVLVLVGVLPIALQNLELGKYLELTEMLVYGSVTLADLTMQLVMQLVRHAVVQAVNVSTIYSGTEHSILPMLW